MPTPFIYRMGVGAATPPRNPLDVAPSIGAPAPLPPIPPSTAQPAQSTAPVKPRPVPNQAQPPSGIPYEGKILLDLIAGPESGGKYNVRYSANGPVTFDNYTAHPRVFETTPDGKRSSAAGRYQITASTWDRLGGGDFSPLNQDKAAWKLAQDDYKTRTGRELAADLKSEGISGRIIQALLPTWAGLSKVNIAGNGPSMDPAAAIGGTAAQVQQTQEAQPQQRPRPTPAPIEAPAPPALPEGVTVRRQQVQPQQQSSAAAPTLQGLRGLSPVAKLTKLAEYGRAIGRA